MASMNELLLTRCSRSEFQQWCADLCSTTAWELRTRRDALSTLVQWLEATFEIAPQEDSVEPSVLLTAYIVYNADFRVPQLGFFASSLLSVDALTAALPHLSFANALLETSSATNAVSNHPIVSCSWHDEVQQRMWLVHPCDTENLLRRSRNDGVRGSLLSLFLHSMAPYFPFPPSLLPAA